MNDHRRNDYVTAYEMLDVLYGIYDSLRWLHIPVVRDEYLKVAQNFHNKLSRYLSAPKLLWLDYGILKILRRPFA